MGLLDKKVVLITGTGGGLGRVAAQTFARERAKVVGCDIKGDTGEFARKLGIKYKVIELGKIKNQFLRPLPKKQNGKGKLFG